MLLLEFYVGTLVLMVQALLQIFSLLDVVGFLADDIRLVGFSKGGVVLNQVSPTSDNAPLQDVRSHCLALIVPCQSHFLTQSMHSDESAMFRRVLFQRRSWQN